MVNFKVFSDCFGVRVSVLSVDVMWLNGEMVFWNDVFCLGVVFMLLYVSFVGFGVLLLM